VSEPAPGNFGAALSRVIADALHHVVLSILPHHHAERVRAHEEWAKSVASDLHGGVAPVFQKLLDTDAVHPALEPLVRRIVKGE
jgi:hypothetical protein